MVFSKQGVLYRIKQPTCNLPVNISEAVFIYFTNDTVYIHTFETFRLLQLSSKVSNKCQLTFEVGLQENIHSLTSLLCILNAILYLCFNLIRQYDFLLNCFEPILSRLQESVQNFWNGPGPRLLLGWMTFHCRSRMSWLLANTPGW